jgi:hemerythrin superfamily protein
MGEYNILPIMIKDHNKIELLTDKFQESAKGDFSAMIKSFNKLEWKLEKHIFVEEKAIFTSYNPEDVTTGYKMLPELTKQHNELLNRLNIMRKDLRSRGLVKDVYSFKEFMIKHKIFEEKEVYPKLDDALDETQKRQIVDKINEII